MPSTSAPSEMEAILHDGETATAHPARVRLTGVGLVLLREDAAPAIIGFAALRLGDRMAGRWVLRHAERPGWRLVLAEAPPQDWIAQLKRAGRPAPRRIALWVGAGAVLAGVVALAVLNGGAILSALAPLLPHSVTEPFGRNMVTFLSRGKECTGAQGLRALESLAARLSPPGGLAEPATVHVVDVPISNAMALPGGHVVFFSRLIKEAESPDEVAGVLAHELGHVQHHHSNQALIRHFGVSIVFNALGGNMGQLADTTLMLDHSREAEREADAFAIARLRSAGISSQGLADFFIRHSGRKDTSSDEKPRPRGKLAEALETFGTYASTHPASRERAAQFKAGAVGEATPALSEAEWQAVRAMCDAA